MVINRLGEQGMARYKNQVETERVVLATTPIVVHYLRELVNTGLFGKNFSEAAERLVAASIERMIRDGELKRFTPRRKR